MFVMYFMTAIFGYLTFYGKYADFTDQSRKGIHVKSVTNPSWKEKSVHLY